jgi:hypothetical protein
LCHKLGQLCAEWLLGIFAGYLQNMSVVKR